MRCAWSELLAILPPRYRQQVDRQGKAAMQELRLRMGAPPEIVTGAGSIWLPETVTREELDHVVNGASRYSPWAAATVAKGYLTAPGGHRIGLCGEAVVKNGNMEGLRQVESLCIRVARDLSPLEGKAGHPEGSILILGAPGWGKTTLLRDLCRRISEREETVVVDERGELFPKGFVRGKKMDVLTLCPKGQGLEMALRCMGPKYIAVDEITGEEDCRGLMEAANCGVNLLATAHGTSVGDLYARKIYRPLTEAGIFDRVLVLRGDKSFTWERMGI